MFREVSKFQVEVILGDLPSENGDISTTHGDFQHQRWGISRAVSYSQALVPSQVVARCLPSSFICTVRKPVQMTPSSLGH